MNSYEIFSSEQVRRYADVQMKKKFVENYCRDLPPEKPVFTFLLQLSQFIILCFNDQLRSFYP